MHMYVNGSMQLGNQRHEMARERYFCRELALSAFRRQTLGRLLYRDGIHLPTLYLLALQRLPMQVELTVCFQESDCDALPGKLIADVIELLATHYPAVMLEMHTDKTALNEGFRTTYLRGYTLRGNAQVIPAFFWSLLFFRVLIEIHTEYTSLDAILQTSDDTDGDDEDDDEYEGFYAQHREAFDRLLAGTEPPAEYILASGYGPIDTFNMREWQNADARVTRLLSQSTMKQYEEILNALS